MKKEELIEMGVEESLAGKIEKKLADYVPYSRFKEVNEAKKELEKQVETIETLNKKISELEKINEEGKGEIEKIRKEAEIDCLLAENGARNKKAVKALIEADKDIVEQIKSLKESDSYLFKEEQNVSVEGIKPNVRTEDSINKVDFDNMTYSESLAYLEAHPDAQI